MYVLRPNGRVHVIDGQPETNQLLRVNPDPHRGFGGEKLQPADAVHPTDFVIDVAGRVVGQRDRILGSRAVLVVQGKDQQEPGTGLFDLQALTEYRLRQARLGFLDTVLNFNLCQVRVGARYECHVDFSAAGRVAGRLVIQHALGTVQLFLDDAGHRIDQHFRGCAGVSSGNGDLRRCHIRVLRHWQGGQGHQTCQQNEQGQHPGKVGSLDKEQRHER